MGIVVDVTLSKKKTIILQYFPYISFFGTWETPERGARALRPVMCLSSLSRSYNGLRNNTSLQWRVLYYHFNWHCWLLYRCRLVAVTQRMKGESLVRASGHSVAAVQQVLNKGADVNARSGSTFGWTPLISAIYHHQVEVVELLVARGAQVNLADDKGQTPLVWAIKVWGENTNVVHYLVQHGADPTLRDKYGGTAFDAAQSHCKFGSHSSSLKRFCKVSLKPRRNVGFESEAYPRKCVWWLRASPEIEVKEPVAAIATFGFTDASRLLVLAGLVLAGGGGGALRAPRPAPSRPRPGRLPAGWRRCRPWHFWSISAPFAFVLIAQVGFLTHLVPLIADRQRRRSRVSPSPSMPSWRWSAASCWASSSTGSSRAAPRPSASWSRSRPSPCWRVAEAPSVIYGACAVYGFSVGNNITLSPLIMQREYAADDFPAIVAAVDGGGADPLRLRARPARRAARRLRQLRRAARGLHGLNLAASGLILLRPRPG